MSDTDLLTDVPATEPVSQTTEAPEKPKRRRGRPPKAATQAAPSAKNATRKAGSDLMPDLDRYKQGLHTTYAYWVGVTDKCPKPGIDVAGVHFPALVGERSKVAAGERELKPGVIVHLRQDQIERMAARLRQTVIRFRDYPAEHQPELGSRYVTATDDSQPQPKGGTIITIPTKEEVDSVRGRGTHYPQYIADPKDEPAARYMYCMLCPDQDRPERLPHYRTIEETGLEWPGDEDE